MLDSGKNWKGVCMEEGGKEKMEGKEGGRMERRQNEGMKKERNKRMKKGGKKRGRGNVMKMNE